MKRYISSFFITLFIYIGITVGFYVLFANEKIIINKKKDTKKISLNHLQIKKEIKEKNIQKKRIKKKEIKQTITKSKLIKNEPIKKKKTIKKETKIVKDTIKKPIKPIKKPKDNKKTVSKSSSQVPLNQSKIYIDKNLLLIRKLIQENIVYSKRAKRFNIQGVVKVKFKISKNGKINKIDILKGHRLLRKSTIEAIKRASKNFPKVPKSLIITLPIEYRLI
ncbi:outer membrane transport energization protein TonB [Malaciobacter marinus]|jgi:protein TonB|uniref:Outer membrane transport energization protein TonB n=1 Tax=Malaciobacter marinus TaxID=505249 RepID=A0AB36ZZ00_9BACT|nr:energy transducer TonB [Malaciobacter marinus]PPK62858.1 outer membrane transport energization protein TonB [Malaciobacter marinus]